MKIKKKMKKKAKAKYKMKWQQGKKKITEMCINTNNMTKRKANEVKKKQQKNKTTKRSKLVYKHKHKHKHNTQWIARATALFHVTYSVLGLQKMNLYIFCNFLFIVFVLELCFARLLALSLCVSLSLSPFFTLWWILPSFSPHFCISAQLNVPFFFSGFGTNQPKNKWKNQQQTTLTNLRTFHVQIKCNYWSWRRYLHAYAKSINLRLSSAFSTFLAQ